jgi:uncharacterized membrane protein
MDIAQSIGLVALSEPNTKTQIWIRHITWESQGKGKKKFPLGLGPSDYWRISTKDLLKLNPPKDKIKPCNPYISLIIDEKLPIEYLEINDESKKVIEETFEFVGIGRDLYCELTQILRNNGFQVENTFIAMEKLSFEEFRKRLIPYVTASAETLHRLKLLSDKQWTRYQKFRMLLKSFEEDVWDKRIVRPDNTYKISRKLFPSGKYLIEKIWSRFEVAPTKPTNTEGE